MKQANYLIFVLAISFAIIPYIVCFSQSSISVEPEGSVVNGRLMASVEGQYSDVITDGFVFALSADKKQVLGFASTLRGYRSTTGGSWKIGGLPMHGKIILVGYANKVHRLFWSEELQLDGSKYYNLGDNIATMTLGSTSPNESANKIIQILFIAGWLTDIYQTGKYYEKIDAITEELERYRIENEIDQSFDQNKPVGKYQLIQQFGNNKWYDSPLPLYYIFEDDQVVIKSEHYSVKTTLNNDIFYQTFIVKQTEPSVIEISTITGQKLYRFKHVNN